MPSRARLRDASSCLQTPWTAARYGPLIRFGGVVVPGFLVPNVAGCMELVGAPHPGGDSGIDSGILGCARPCRPWAVASSLPARPTARCPTRHRSPRTTCARATPISPAVGSTPLQRLAPPRIGTPEPPPTSVPTPARTPARGGRAGGLLRVVQGLLQQGCPSLLRYAATAADRRRRGLKRRRRGLGRRGCGLRGRRDREGRRARLTRVIQGGIPMGPEDSTTTTRTSRCGASWATTALRTRRPTPACRRRRWSGPTARCVAFVSWTRA